MTPNFRLPVAFALVLALTAPGFRPDHGDAVRIADARPIGPCRIQRQADARTRCTQGRKATRLDKREQQRMDKDMNICKGC